MVGKYRKLNWTEHSKIKMRQYGLSKIKLINLIHKPERKESGIVPGTTALMKTNKVYGNKTKLFDVKKPWQNKKKSPGEIWLMYKDVKDERRVISAWRYPGITKPGDQIPIPEDIRSEILKNGI